jgi:hypothetical protein
MANIEGQLRTLVLSNGTVASLISARMYYLIAPEQETFPYVVYQDVSDPHVPMSFDITTNRQPRFQFDVYGTSAVSVVDVRDAIIGVLRWYQGTVGTLTANVIQIANVQSMLVEDSVIYRSIIDAIVDYQEG